MIELKIGDRVAKTTDISKVVGFGKDGAVVIEQGNYFNLVVIPKTELTFLGSEY